MFSEIGDVSLILKRDQRTIKNLLLPMDTVGAEFCREYKKGECNKFSISRLPVMFFRISNLGMHTIADSNFRPCSTPRYKARNARIIVNNFMKRLVQVFIFGVCFLSIVRIPTAMTAPMSCRDRDGAKWKNPCGQELVMENNSGGSSSSETDRDIIGPILTMARVTLAHMHTFKEDYIRVTFKASYHHHVKMASHIAHDWLPNKKTEVPKNLGELVDITHLESQKLDQFLLSIYESMQKYAVGIEQVVIDQQNTSGNSVPNFQRQFNDTEANLRKVLCEIRWAMNSRNIKPLKNVDRCIMDQSTRSLSETAQRNYRDWIIFKECMNGLEYLIQVLEYLEAKPPS